MLPHYILRIIIDKTAIIISLNKKQCFLQEIITTVIVD